MNPFDPLDESVDVSNFTPRAQVALSLARREAIRFRQEFIETEHVLLGLIKLGQGVAVNVLGDLGLNLENVRAEAEKLIGNIPNEKAVENPTYSPRTKHVLQMAKEGAKALHHTYIGTEHLLLGLLHDKEGLAAKIFQKLSVNVEKVRTGILKELNPYYDDGQKGP